MVKYELLKAISQSKLKKGQVRTTKQEEVYPNEYTGPYEAKERLLVFFDYYNHRKPLKIRLHPGSPLSIIDELHLILFCDCN